MQDQEPKPFTDAEATPLHWFLLEAFTRELFGKHYEISKPVEVKKEAA